MPVQEKNMKQLFTRLVSSLSMCSTMRLINASGAMWSAGLLVLSSIFLFSQMATSAPVTTAQTTLAATAPVPATSLTTAPAGAARETTMETVPRIEWGECAITVRDNGKTRCGYLVVHEDQRTKQGKSIRLPFAVMKSDSATPLADPILYTGGGPGSSSLNMVNNREYIPYLKNRDFIVFEQRGTRYAQPNLGCPEVNEAQREAVQGNFSKPDAEKLLLRAVGSCRDRLVGDGVNLSAYNSAASAADIEALRRLLNYSKWNLYGMSYSTRLMLTVMRDYPHGIRSVLLDSVLPPMVNYDETSVDHMMRSLNLVFSACKADATCNAAYPDLEERFYSLVQKFDEQPASVEIKDAASGTSVQLLLNGSDVVNGVYDALENGDAIPSLPSLISRAAQNDVEALTTLGKTKLQVSSFSWGMRYSVWCSEEMPFQDRSLIKKQSTTAYPKLKGFGIQRAFPAICDLWKVEPAGAIENEPVRSDIPTLILAGEYDPDTPPAWGNSRLRPYPTVTSMSFPGQATFQPLAPPVRKSWQPRSSTIP
jgi:pimeloyl-ACP methyl ester carboxylesterase